MYKRIFKEDLTDSDEDIDPEIIVTDYKSFKSDVLRVDDKREALTNAIECGD